VSGILHFELRQFFKVFVNEISESAQQLCPVTWRDRAP
jgi:hypothetical protein